MKNGNIAQAEQPKPASHRDSNIELFRIITMFFIVAHHYVVNSGLTLEDGPIAPIRCLAIRFSCCFSGHGEKSA